MMTPLEFIRFLKTSAQELPEFSTIMREASYGRHTHWITCYSDEHATNVAQVYRSFGFNAVVKKETDSFRGDEFTVGIYW